MVRALEIQIKIQRDDKCSAVAIYNGEKVIVQKGSIINMNPSPYARGRIIRQYRMDESVVSKEGVVLSDCTFPSVSSAARFVTGRSENGYNAWKVDDNQTLNAWLAKEGFRIIKRRFKGKEM